LLICLLLSCSNSNCRTWSKSIYRSILITRPTSHPPPPFFRIPSRCNIISLGMYNEITFEQELQHITNKRCKLYAYDMVPAASDESRNDSIRFQVLIEIHGSPADTVSLLRKISSQGYWLYSYEINGAWHHLCEFSFIHKSAFKRYGVTPVARYLD
uniref:Methyltranfer_dom domain-containing protein n=1 Tax=Heligmosomoides polygyrus TaxID=6339 RepID=A0A183GNI0_HELPZ